MGIFKRPDEGRVEEDMVPDAVNPPGTVIESQEIHQGDSVLDITPDDDSGLLYKETLDTLFSADTHKIIQVSDFSKDDLSDVSRIETFFHLVILPFCDVHNANNFRVLVDKLYQLTVSIGRKGRDELFEAIRPQQTLLDMQDMQRGGRRKV